MIGGAADAIEQALYSCGIEDSAKVEVPAVLRFLSMSVPVDTIVAIAKRGAVSAHVAGNGGAERSFLDILAVLEQAALLRTD